jgi:hypothetical protein
VTVVPPISPSAAASGSPAAATSTERGLTRRYLRSAAARADLSGYADSELLGVAYGGRLLDRPVFLEADQQAGLAADVAATFDLLAGLPARLFGGSLTAMARAVGMTPLQAEAVRRGCADVPLRLGRADLYQEAGGFRLLEFNTGSALGGFDNAELNRAFLRDPDLAAFVAAEGLEFTDTLRGIADTIRAACAGLDAPSRPVVALVDWPRSFPELERRLGFMARLLDPLGFEAVPCHVGQLEERGGMLFVRGRRIDIVYRFFVIADLLDGPDAPAVMEPVLAAAERGTVRLFAPLDLDVYGSKAALALLSDEGHRSAFTPAELRLIDRFLPWTRRLHPGPVHVDGQETDLLPYVLAHRDELVLKPNMLYAGLGVVPGWTTDAAEWERHVRSASGGPFVVQRRVRPVAERFPAAGRCAEPGAGPAGAGSARSAEMFLNWGVYLVSGGYGGALVRATADPEAGVVGMATGAKAGCCFHPERRAA